MTPNTWLGIVGFFFFVSPGLYYDRKTALKRMKPPESTFAEISRVALVSTVCSVPAVLLLSGFAAVCAWRRWKILPDPAALLKQGTSYYADNFVRVSVTFLAAAVLAVVSAELLYRWVHRNDKGTITFESAWRAVLQVDAPGGTVPHARISMKDGSVWTGEIAHYSRGTEVADREIVIAPPITRKPKPNQNGPRAEAGKFPDVYERVILKDTEIAYIAVKYEPDRNTSPSTGTAPSHQTSGAHHSPSPAQNTAQAASAGTGNP
ncbi:DUF6338 family protein [Nocardia mangyaensis]|uniref:DUF6338 family protein n=1 Tax=Nocardia mangyaensis TaxID=2213200 RepID=UPI0026747962|nr:DUF6338 family protein [Nocardia mangyaensis]MDO3648673.1 DUF6338 family protein [Nocardia mangyaensis]